MNSQEFIKIVAGNIKNKRLESGMSVDELSDLMGVEHSQVNKWERGVCFPRATTLTQLASFLKCNVFDFFKE